MDQSVFPKSIGIDVSKSKIDVAILFNASETKIKQFPNRTKNDMDSLIDWLNDNNISHEVPIVIESTSTYHWLSCMSLSQAGFAVHLLNPLITKKYQKASIRGAKSDSIDAKRLAEIAIIEKDIPLFIESHQSLANKKYHSLYAKILKIKQQLSNSYKNALDSADTLGIELDLNSIKSCLIHINETLKILRKIIEQNASKTALELAEISGVSKFQAAIISSALHGKNFKNKDKLIAFFGLDVRVKQSGSWRGKEKLSKRGNSFYRLILFQLGWSLVRNNSEFQKYYQRLRDNGKHYYTCIIATARKFLKFIYAHYLFPEIS